jgi:hypothetical protein
LCVSCDGSFFGSVVMMGDFAHYDGVLVIVLAEAVVWHIDVPFAMVVRAKYGDDE